MSDFEQLLIDILNNIKCELSRIAVPEAELMELQLEQARRGKDTRDMRRAKQARCGNCVNFVPADWGWMESHGRAHPYVQCWTGWCSAQTRSPRKVRGDPTERQSDSPPCRHYEALHGPEFPPLDPQEKTHER